MFSFKKVNLFYLFVRFFSFQSVFSSATCKTIDFRSPFKTFHTCRFFKLERYCCVGF